MTHAPGRRGAAEDSDFANFQAFLQTAAQSHGVVNPAPNPLTKILADGMGAVMVGATLLLGAAVHVINTSIYHLPTIGLSAGLAFGANELARRYQPHMEASMEPILEGSFKVALLVGTTFFTKAVIDPVLTLSINTQDAKPDEREKKLYATAVRYLCPLTITVIAARVYGLKVKTLEGALYTLGLFSLIKVLEKGFQYGANVRGISWVLDKVYD